MVDVLCVDVCGGMQIIGLACSEQIGSVLCNLSRFVILRGLN